MSDVGVKTVAELRDFIGWLVNANLTVPNQDFTGPSNNVNKLILRALNLRYKKEVQLGMQNGSKRSFMKEHTVTWASDADTLAIPTNLIGVHIDTIYDTGDATEGVVVFSTDRRNHRSGIYLKDNETFGWYPAPSADRTLTFSYIAVPETLEDDLDEPSLIPEQYRELLGWSTALMLFRVGNTKAPDDWKQELQEARLSYWKYLSLGGPLGFPPPVIRHVDNDVVAY